MGAKSSPIINTNHYQVKSKAGRQRRLEGENAGEIITKHITMGNAREGRERNATVE